MVLTIPMDLSRLRQFKTAAPTDDLLVAMAVTRSHLLQRASYRCKGIIRNTLEHTQVLGRDFGQENINYGEFEYHYLNRVKTRGTIIPPDCIEHSINLTDFMS